MSKIKYDTNLTPGKEESWSCGGTASILPDERKKGSFDVKEMTHILNGGPKLTTKRRFILSPVTGENYLFKYNLTRPELLEAHVRHFFKTHESFWDSYIPTREEVAWMSSNSVMGGALMNHYGLFLPTIVSQCTPEQQSWWLFRAFQMTIIGCYAQTELGHGSNVRGLQTAATFDKSKQQFVLNTPTLRSMKWWPGALGKVATHAIVYAQLILDGKEYGIHAFMLQIRDENHKPFPGITLGDVGPKLGDAANDTGFMRLQNVRIPRKFMLGKFQHVDENGNYVRSGERKKNSKLHYATMMFTRGTMVKTAGGMLSRAVTIATRYSCVRKQGFVDTSHGVSYKSPQNQIIDYQIQRYRIIRSIALAYAMNFTGTWMLHRFKDLEGSEAQSQLKNVESLPELAATSAGLKAMCTFLSWTGIEDVRKCCGGNGYLLASGIAPLTADYAWQITAEGDWIILILQTARFLMKKLKLVMSGEENVEKGGVVGYLTPMSNPSFKVSDAAPSAPSSFEGFLDLSVLNSYFQYRALVSVVSAGREFEAKQKEMSFDKAFNSCALRFFGMVQCHIYAFMYDRFRREVEEVKNEACKRVLVKLVAIFGLSNMLDDANWNGILCLEEMEKVKLAIARLLEDIRPNCVSLVDAFDIPDAVLNSVIGRFDGNVYESLYGEAVKSTLNLKDPFEGYQTMRKYLDIDFLKMGNNLTPEAKL